MLCKNYKANYEQKTRKYQLLTTTMHIRFREIEGCEIREIAGNPGKREIAGCEKREIAGILWEFPQIGSTFFLWNVTYET